MIKHEYRIIKYAQYFHYSIQKRSIYEIEKGLWYTEKTAFTKWGANKKLKQLIDKDNIRHRSVQSFKIIKEYRHD